MDNDIKIHERIRGLEVKVDLILNNHLPHLEKKVDRLNAKFWAIIMLVITTLVSVVIGQLR